MTRRGSALFVALVVVLLGGLVVVMVTMVASAEVRAGTAWAEQEHARTSGASAAARAIPAAEAGYPLLLRGETLVLDDTVSLVRLGDSTALLSIGTRSRLGEDLVSIMARTAPDSLGILRLRVAARSRGRFHPIP